MPPAHAAEPGPGRPERARDRWLVPRWYELAWDSLLDLEVRLVGGRTQDWVIGLVVAAGVLAVVGQGVAAVVVIGGW